MIHQKTITIVARTAEQLNMFESFINFIDTCSRTGMSRELSLSISEDVGIFIDQPETLACAYDEFEKGYGKISFRNGEPFHWDIG